jgi:hypothetical protein
MRARTKAFIAVGGAIVGLNVVAAIVNGLEHESPGGPVSSSYATAPDGLAGYADLLRRAGHPVTRLRVPFAEAELDPRDTVVVLDADGVTRRDAETLAEFVRNGGRLVVGGSRPLRWLRTAVPAAPPWQADPVTAPRPQAPVPEIAGVDRVTVGRGGSWATTGAALPALGAGKRSLLSVTTDGAGRVLLLSNAGPLQNARLAAADNAQLGLGLAGGAARRVVFAESYHGYGESSAGLSAIPAAWKVTLGLGLLAVLVLMLARGRRFGPPEPFERELSPPRRDYVDALATTLSRRRDRANGAQALRVRARAILLDDAAADDDLDGLSRRLERAGLPSDEARALVRTPANDTELVAAGQALASLERISHGRTM